MKPPFQIAAAAVYRGGCKGTSHMDATLWVFGYGSLMWNPGFAHSERQVAVLEDYHRSFCMWSIHYRGTVENPGLVLALDQAAGARCYGVAFAVDQEQAAQTLDYLRQRELISLAYSERHLPVTLADGRRVTAVSYVVNRDHVQYCHGQSAEEQAAIIARSTGTAGRNDDYLFNTVAHLTELGIIDPDLVTLANLVRAMGTGE
jgi:glutathione-specific gamma-glutamylcyclotransferase